MFCLFIIMKNYINLSFIRFYFYFNYFSLYKSSLSDTFWISDFPPKFHYIFVAICSFIRKDICLVLSKCVLYALTFGSIIHKGIIFQNHLRTQCKYLKLLLPKATLLDTTILSTFKSCIEIGLWCWWNLCFSTSMFLNVIISLPILYMVLTSFNLFLFLQYSSPLS